ncbi:MAG: hypothetical protein IJX01_08660 [Oscillospiraceae bacterium]|nr:hypothetical protein [Oscillospiraceae bacterium]
MLPKEERITSKAQMKEWISYELSCYGKRRNTCLPVTEYAILRKHLILLRKTEYHSNCRHRLLGLYYKLRLGYLQNKHALHIPPNVCAKGLHIMHLGPVLVSNDAVIGEDCTLHVNTGVVAGGTNHGVPTLGKGVVVGFGAVVLGNIHVADYVAIGANAVVNKDVTEANIAVAGVPAKKISNNGRKAWNQKEAE